VVVDPDGAERHLAARLARQLLLVDPQGARHGGANRRDALPHRGVEDGRERVVPRLGVDDEPRFSPHRQAGQGEGEQGEGRAEGHRGPFGTRLDAWMPGPDSGFHPSGATSATHGHRTPLAPTSDPQRRTPGPKVLVLRGTSTGGFYTTCYGR